MQDALTWGAVVASSSSIIAVVRFWMWIGAKVAKAEAAAAIAQAALAKADLTAADLVAHKVEAANRYATASALAEAERDISAKVDGVARRLDMVNERLDRVLEALVDRRG
jgi:hypothetical protein